MGWGSGSRLMKEVIRGLNEQRIPETLRASFYKILIPAMRDRDWDTECECLGIDAAYDKTLRELDFEQDAVMALPDAVMTVLGGVGAISPALYCKALCKIAELTGRDISDPEFRADVRAECEKLPCPLN